MDVRIYRPAKTAMQSGTANSKRWLMDFEPTAPKITDPVMGWTGSPDTREQVKLRFASRDEAVAFAEKHDLAYSVTEPQDETPQPKSYAANFSYDRVRS
ncbi:MAG: ETC complex I subunit [Proteobacteria bacterium]|nr:ETC complex I subunit [Pseudomonadota bacterium]